MLHWQKNTEMLDIVWKSCTRDTALLAVLAGIMCKDCCCVENLVLAIVWKTWYILCGKLATYMLCGKVRRRMTLWKHNLQPQPATI